MTPVLLLATNFLRQHRWPVLVLFAWNILTALAAGGFARERVVTDDVIFYLQQQAVYLCVFSAFLAASAIQNERKSRRILLVLSKAVSRGKYLLAILVAICAVAISYALLFGVCGVWLCARAMLPSAGLWAMVVLAIAGSVLASTAALFFSTFLNPYFALGATLLLFSAPTAFHPQAHSWHIASPGMSILLDILHFTFRPEWIPHWSAAIFAIAESILLWALAALIFARIDIAVPVE